jgi:hypothetical protein
MKMDTDRRSPLPNRGVGEAEMGARPIIRHGSAAPPSPWEKTWKGEMAVESGTDAVQDLYLAPQSQNIYHHL